MTLCHLLSSWRPLTPSSKALNVYHLAGSVFSSLLPPIQGVSQKGILLCIPFGMSLNQKSLQDGTWPRSPTSWTMAMQSFTTKEALLKKQSTCLMGSRKGWWEVVHSNFINPSGCGSLHPKIPKVMSTLCERLCWWPHHHFSTWHDHASVLCTVSKKCSDIDLEIRPDKCVSVVYNGSKVRRLVLFPLGRATQGICPVIQLVSWATH